MVDLWKELKVAEGADVGPWRERHGRREIDTSTAWQMKMSRS